MDWRRNMQISRQQIKIWSHPLCPQYAYMHRIRSDGGTITNSPWHTHPSVIEGEQPTFSGFWKGKAWFWVLHHRSVFPSHEPDLASFWQHILSIRAHYPSNGRMRAALGHTVLWHTKNQEVLKSLEMTTKPDCLMCTCLGLIVFIWLFNLLNQFWDKGRPWMGRLFCLTLAQKAESSRIVRGFWSR